MLPVARQRTLCAFAAIALAVAMACASRGALAGDSSAETLAARDVGSVRVGPIRVEGGANRDRGRLSLSLGIGQRLLWTSPEAVLPVTWPVSLRAYTARRQPLVVLVQSGGILPLAPSVRSRGRSGKSSAHHHPSSNAREQDANLATALGDLVIDYGTGTLDDPGEPFDQSALQVPAAQNRSHAAAVPPSGVSSNPTSLMHCKVALEWPPEDGEHRLA